MLGGPIDSHPSTSTLKNTMVTVLMPTHILPSAFYVSVITIINYIDLSNKTLEENPLLTA